MPTLFLAQSRVFVFAYANAPHQVIHSENLTPFYLFDNVMLCYYSRTILYECAGDYVRGWVAALEWVLED